MSQTLYFRSFTVDGAETLDNPLQLVMNKDISVTANYDSDMGTQPLKGEVNKQAATGEAVTIKITKPGGAQDTLNAVTDATGAFVASPYTNVLGDYTGTATIGEDTLYLAATSAPFAFTLTKDARTITLHG